MCAPASPIKQAAVNSRKAVDPRGLNGLNEGDMSGAVPRPHCLHHPHQGRAPLHVQLPLRVNVSKFKSEDLKNLYIDHIGYLDACGLRK